jgi:hypothetical protein
MNRFLPIIALWFVVGCGSEEPVFGGFTPTGGSALIFSPTICEINSAGSTAISGIELDFTSYAYTCDIINQTQLCGYKIDATVMIGEVGGTIIDPVGPGKYNYLKDLPAGTFRGVMGVALETIAIGPDTCIPTPNSVGMTGGSITISSVTETKVVGSTNMHFQDGRVFQYEFELPICNVTIDMCTLFRGGQQ